MALGVALGDSVDVIVGISVAVWRGAWVLVAVAVGCAVGVVCVVAVGATVSVAVTAIIVAVALEVATTLSVAVAVTIGPSGVAVPVVRASRVSCWTIASQVAAFWGIGVLVTTRGVGGAAVAVTVAVGMGGVAVGVGSDGVMAIFVVVAVGDGFAVAVGSGASVGGKGIVPVSTVRAGSLSLWVNAIAVCRRATMSAFWSALSSWTTGAFSLGAEL